MSGTVSEISSLGLAACGWAVHTGWRCLLLYKGGVLRTTSQDHQVLRPNTRVIKRQQVQWPCNFLESLLVRVWLTGYRACASACCICAPIQSMIRRAGRHYCSAHIRSANGHASPARAMTISPTAASTAGCARGRTPTSAHWTARGECTPLSLSLSLSLSLFLLLLSLVGPGSGYFY